MLANCVELPKRKIVAPISVKTAHFSVLAPLYAADSDQNRLIISVDFTLLKIMRIMTTTVFFYYPHKGLHASGLIFAVNMS